MFGDDGVVNNSAVFVEENGKGRGILGEGGEGGGG